MNERLQKQLDFLREIDKSKSVFRQNYLADGSRKENDAEHGWHMALFACILQEYFPGADLNRVLPMALMHDLIEIDAGDTYCYDTAGQVGKAEREAAAARRIYGLLPPEQGEKYLALWQEFEAQETPDAQFAAVLDRIQPLLLQFSSQGKSWKEHDICTAQVRERNAVTFRFAPEPIRQLVDGILDEAVRRGYIKP